MFSVSFPPPATVTGAFTAIALAAHSVRCEPVDHVSGDATVIVPACVPGLTPAAPVDTVTLAVASAFSSVATPSTLSLALAVNVPKLFVVSRSAAAEIVMSYGSSSSVPNRPFAAVRIVVPS